VTGPGAQGSLEDRMFLVLMFSLTTFVGLFSLLIVQRSAQLANEEALEELRRQLI
jgi:hypothetical protein